MGRTDANALNRSAPPVQLDVYVHRPPPARKCAMGAALACIGLPMEYALHCSGAAKAVILTVHLTVEPVYDTTQPSAAKPAGGVFARHSTVAAITH